MKTKNGILIAFITICFLTMGFVVVFPQETKIDPPLFLYDYKNTRLIYPYGFNNDIPNVYKEKIITKHVSFNTLNEATDIYIPNKNGYRYGPSIIKNDDNTYDIFYSSPGNNSTEWDYIRYIHIDKKNNISKEKIVLKPTKNSLDKYSVCDPGVIYFDGYYYLAYTSTSTKSGYNNSIFVARSKDVDGPYEKWSGKGWGGKPYPVISIENNEEYFGVAEPSFVIKDNKLYMYYSSHTYFENGTRLATFDLCKDWPNTLEYKDMVISWTNLEDSYDVVYLDDLNKFVAFSVFNRMMKNSKIGIYESDDGINFTYSYSTNDNISNYAHNLGISKSLEGHALFSDSLLLGYAHSTDNNNKWGRWSFCIQGIKLDQFEKEE